MDWTKTAVRRDKKRLFKFWDSVRLVLEAWRYVEYIPESLQTVLYFVAVCRGLMATMFPYSAEIFPRRCPNTTTWNNPEWHQHSKIPAKFADDIFRYIFLRENDCILMIKNNTEVYS